MLSPIRILLSFFVISPTLCHCWFLGNTKLVFLPCKTTTFWSEKTSCKLGLPIKSPNVGFFLTWLICMFCFVSLLILSFCVTFKSGLVLQACNVFNILQRIWIVFCGLLLQTDKITASLFFEWHHYHSVLMKWFRYYKKGVFEIHSVLKGIGL